MSRISPCHLITISDNLPLLFQILRLFYKHTSASALYGTLVAIAGTNNTRIYETYQLSAGQKSDTIETSTYTLALPGLFTVHSRNVGGKDGGFSEKVL